MQHLFTRIASKAAHVMGQPVTFIVATGFIVVWAATGPLLHYSDTWQLIVNTATTVLTFLAVFLIQNSQNRDGAAVQAKLDELIRAVEGARNHFIGIEHLTEEQLEAIRSVCEREAENAEAGLISAMELENNSAAASSSGRQSPGAASPELDQPPA